MYRFPFFPHPHQLVIEFSLRTAILTGGRRQLLAVLICISLRLSGWASRQVPTGHLRFLFGKLPISSSAHLVTGLFVCMMLSNKSCSVCWLLTLLATSFANIFSHSVGGSLLSLMVSFAVQKLLSLIRPNLFTFAFISVALGDSSKNYCYDLCQRQLCLCSLLRLLWVQILHLGL